MIRVQLSHARSALIPSWRLHCSRRHAPRLARRLTFFEKGVISNYVLCCSAGVSLFFFRVFDEGRKVVKRMLMTPAWRQKVQTKKRKEEINEETSFLAPILCDWVDLSTVSTGRP